MSSRIVKRRRGRGDLPFGECGVRHRTLSSWRSGNQHRARARRSSAPGYISPDAETLHPDGKLQEHRWHNLHAAIRPLKMICRYANKVVPVVLPETIDTCVLERRRAASALLLTDPRGERASAALPRRQAKRRAESAPYLKRDRRPRRAPEGRPRWPEGQHPNPPPKAGKGALRRAHSGTPGLFWFGLEIRRSCSRRRRERWGPLVWKEASCSGIRSWGFAVRAGRRMAGACDCDGRRQASFSVSGLAR